MVHIFYFSPRNPITWKTFRPGKKALLEGVAQVNPSFSNGVLFLDILWIHWQAQSISREAMSVQQGKQSEAKKFKKKLEAAKQKGSVRTPFFFSIDLIFLHQKYTFVLGGIWWHFHFLLELRGKKQHCIFHDERSKCFLDFGNISHFFSEFAVKNILLFWPSPPSALKHFQNLTWKRGEKTTHVLVTARYHIIF